MWITASKPPKIKKVKGLTGKKTSIKDWMDDHVAEGSFVQIEGVNFGDPPGSFGVALEYGEPPKEFETATPPLKYRSELIPIYGDWSKSWRDTGIVAELPFLPQSKIAYWGQLVVWRKGPQSFELKYAVSIERFGTQIRAVHALPSCSDNVLSSGGMLAVYGHDFGNVTKPTVSLHFKNPVGIPHTISLKTTVWDNTVIYADIPKCPGNYPDQNGELRVLNTKTNTLASQPIVFGPKMVYTVVSGKDYMELAIPSGKANKDYAQEGQDFLLVTHDPDCGAVVGDGNDGVDQFFTKKMPLPANCTIVKTMCAQLDPVNTWDALVWFVKQIPTSPAGLIVKLGEVVIFGLASAFDGGIGKYYANFYKHPETGPVQVCWQNTCSGMSPFNGVPLKYLIGFVLRGPEGIVPGTAKQ